MRPFVLVIAAPGPPRRLLARPLPPYQSPIPASPTTSRDLIAFPSSGRVEKGVDYEYTLGTHCGLDQGVDFDGSLWDYAGPRVWTTTAATALPDLTMRDTPSLTTIASPSCSATNARLSAVRKIFLTKMRGMTIGDFNRTRSLPNYEVSPAWALHHLAQHEAEHRGGLASAVSQIRNGNQSGTADATR